MQLMDKILVVDDVLENIQVVMNILKEENCDLSFATNGMMALELAEKERFDMILLDIMMPGLDGIEVCRRIRKIPEYQYIPIIFLSAKNDIDSINEGFEAGGVDYITKPFHASELLARVHTHLELYHARAMLEFSNISLKNKLDTSQLRYVEEIQENQKEMLHLLMELMEATSDETAEHMQRVAEYSRLLAHYHPVIPERDASIMYYAALMHDIGKIVIPVEILHKQGPLSEEEFNLIKTHTDIAFEFFKMSQRKLIKMAAVIAYEHHERWDGEGYPRKLKGESIHLYGRIVALADVFDAISHKRVYKKAWPMEQAIAYIKEQSGRQFDPALVAIFEEHLDEFLAISNR
jgi:putative two-component system response regulator